MNLSIAEAIKNGEIIPLADSQLLRFIDELNHLENVDEKILSVKKEIRHINKSNYSYSEKRKLLKEKYNALGNLQYKSDYICLVIDKNKDYERAYKKGFCINGIKYSRLLATNGGVKNSIIIFTSERLKPELRKRIENGRNPKIPLVPAKFGAYEALCCSSSIPVSSPKGILVIKDCFTEFYEDVITLDYTNTETPYMSEVNNYKITKNCSDGYGTMTPERARIWSKELGLDYVISGCNTRYSFEKGMLVVFDHIAFAEKIMGACNDHQELYYVTDVWGNKVDVRSVDVILTESMLKLWNAYNSIDDYLKNCHENHYEFSITKVTPKELENTRNLNYQFIQSYRLDDNDITALTSPTINLIKDIIGDDYRKTILYSKGTKIDKNNVEYIENDCIKALMIDHRLNKDPFVRSYIFKLIQKRINEAKIGVLDVKGNFQMICGDPYALWQSIYGLKVTGLLKKGEVYSKYWSDKNVGEMVAFRAPMTCHNNIRKLKVTSDDDMKYWYKGIETMIILNSWDTTTDATNGSDYDGDAFFTTNNKVLMDKYRYEKTILCMQNKAEKHIITEDLLYQANYASFGDDIGIYTNGITSQFEIQAGFDMNSPEFKELDYRIKCGQLFQQDAIDKCKGIISKPRPQWWFDYSSNKTLDTDDDKTRCIKEFNMKLIADRKPYFMQYVYPNLKKAYKKYISNSNKKCMTEFKITIQELYDKKNKTASELEFLHYYEKRMPVGTNRCVMNKICEKIEKAFDGYLASYKQNNTFDYSILKANAVYSKDLYKKVENLYKDYCDKVKKYKHKAKTERIDEETSFEQRLMLIESYKRECDMVCPDPYKLLNILLDMCYGNENSKQFVWDMCTDTIIEVLLAKNDGIITYPEANENGDIEFNGERFSMHKKKIGDDNY